jgi:hypothetical protein
MAAGLGRALRPGGVPRLRGRDRLSVGPPRLPIWPGRNGGFVTQGGFQGGPLWRLLALLGMRVVERAWNRGVHFRRSPLRSYMRAESKTCRESLSTFVAACSVVVVENAASRASDGNRPAVERQVGRGVGPAVGPRVGSKCAEIGALPHRTGDRRPAVLPTYLRHPRVGA